MKKALIYPLLLTGLMACQHKPIRTVRILTSNFFDCYHTTYGKEFIPVSYLEISDTGTVKFMLGQTNKSEKVYYLLDTDDCWKQRLLDSACNDSIYEPYPSDMNKNPPNHTLFSIELTKDNTTKRCSYYQYGSNKQQQLLIAEFYKLSREVSEHCRFVRSNTPFDISEFVEQTRKNLPSSVAPPSPLRSKLVHK